MPPRERGGIDDALGYSPLVEWRTRRATPQPAAEEAAERGGPVVFEDDGFRILHGRRGGVIRYRDIVHLGVSRRAVAIGTTRDTVVLRRRFFANEKAMRALDAALRERVAALPGGELRLARMVELDALARARASHVATYVFIAACLIAFGKQWDDPFATHAGSFVPALVGDGELWRLFTAHFLHDTVLFPLHLGLNLVCILVVGSLVERALGSRRTVVVMGVSAVGSMYGCMLAGYGPTLGASGVVAGLAGALLCIELNGSRRLPVWWRVPRRIFIAAILAQGVVDWFVPIIAGAAHLGGFLTGYLVTRLFVSDALLRRPVGLPTRLAAAAIVLAVGASAVAVGPLIGRDGAALERHALRVLRSDRATAREDNTVAWVMVTESQPSDLGVQMAAALAERAVAQTQRRNPDLLDTLAEVLFVLGDIPGALIAIDEAIELSGGEPYFVEQRRRFIGERAPDDRPAPPPRPWLGRPRRQAPDRGVPPPDHAPDDGVFI